MKKSKIITLFLLLVVGAGLRAQNNANDPVDPGPPLQADVVEVAEAVEPEAPAAAAVPEAVPVVPPGEEPQESESQPPTSERQRGTRIDRGDIVIISNNSHLAQGERAQDMVTIMGNSVSEGHVDGDMVTVLGNAKLDGYVDGDFVVVMGSADFGPHAKVDGDVVVIGGRMNVHPDADVDGETVSIPFFSPGMVKHFQELPLFVRECVFLGRPISPKVVFTCYIAGIFLIFYLLLAALFPRPLERGRKAIEEKPLQSFFAGVLVLACYIPFVIILLITVVGVLLIPIANLALLAVAIFGKAVVFFFIGKQIARAIRLGFLKNAILSILLGGAIVYALYVIPFFGIFLWLLLSVFGLGAVSMAIGDSISEKKAARVAALPAPAAASAHETRAGEETVVPTAEPAKTQPGTPLSQVDDTVASLFPRVGFWWRTFATMIDLLIVAAITFLLGVATFILPMFAYFIIFWSWKGSTLGGMALGLRVQKLSGEPLDWSTSIIRSLSAIVSFLPFFLGFFWAGWDPENQSWHDKIAGTTVVQIPKGYTWS